MGTGTDAPESSGRRGCPECGAEFEDREAVRDHYFERHLVTGATESRGNRDGGPAAADAASDSPSPDHPGTGTGTGARVTDPRSDAETAGVAAGRPPGRRLPTLPELFVVLFVLVFLGIPAVALALALA